MNSQNNGSNVDDPSFDATSYRLKVYGSNIAFIYSLVMSFR